MEQRTDEWFAARLGKVTASKISDVVAKTRNGWGASRGNYMAQLLCERLTGQPTENFVNAAMQHGIDTEPQARAAYEFLTDNTVTEVGFIPHPDIEMAGASPDGLIGKLGNLEIKCPNQATHLNTLLDAKVPKKYADQIQWQMACTGTEWTDFVSFDPRFPAAMQLWTCRIGRDEDRIDELESAVIEFLAELQDKLDRLTLKEAAE